jgi:putative transcriptional regulator
LPLKYKTDILAALREAGYTTYRIREDGLLSQSTLQKIREGKGVSWDNIETVCRLLSCQPGDLMEYVP